MSFLAGRLAATEGAYFLHESKQAVGRLAQRLPPSASAQPKPPTDDAAAADVLPEILRHSVPLTPVHPEADPSISASKWLLPRSPLSGSPAASRDALNPLRAYVSLPQATFGPKRWQLPDEHPTFTASTANELRGDRYPTVDSERLKVMASGISTIVKAFAIATTIVFGGAAIVFYRLQMYTNDDIRSKGKDLLQRELIWSGSKWAHYDLGLRTCRESGISKVTEKLRRSRW